MYHCTNGELKLRVLANVRGGRKKLDLYCLWVGPPTSCMGGRAMTDSQLA